MPGKKQWKNYKEKLKGRKFLLELRRQETVKDNWENVVAAENVVLQAKRSESVEKLKLNCPLTEIETNEVLTRS